MWTGNWLSSYIVAGWYKWGFKNTTRLNPLYTLTFISIIGIMKCSKCLSDLPLT